MNRTIRLFATTSVIATLGLLGAACSGAPDASPEDTSESAAKAAGRVHMAGVPGYGSLDVSISPTSVANTFRYDVAGKRSDGTRVVETVSLSDKDVTLFGDKGVTYVRLPDGGVLTVEHVEQQPGDVQVITFGLPTGQSVSVRAQGLGQLLARTGADAGTGGGPIHTREAAVTITVVIVVGVVACVGGFIAWLWHKDSSCEEIMKNNREHCWTPPCSFYAGDAAQIAAAVDAEKSKAKSNLTASMGGGGNCQTACICPTETKGK